jgi:hypothetical protein
MDENGSFAHQGLLAKIAKYGPISPKTSTPHFAFGHSKSLASPSCYIPRPRLNLGGGGGGAAAIRDGCELGLIGARHTLVERPNHKLQTEPLLQSQLQIHVCGRIDIEEQLAHQGHLVKNAI